MVTLKELGFPSIRNWDETISEWIFIGMSDFSCVSCNIFTLLIAPSTESDFPSEFKTFCASCHIQKRIVDFPLTQQNLMLDKFKIIKDSGLEKNAKETLETIFNLNKILTGLEKKGFAQNKVESHTRDSSQNLPRTFSTNGDSSIPEGYRNVAWLRNYEAEAIIKSFESKSNFESNSDDMKASIKCLYFSENSEERKKFKSNVQAIRVNNQNQRVIGWIRFEEAQAVVESNRIKGDLEFNHLLDGKGGRVQYFPENSEIAKKYRSTTRLLRKN